MADWSRLSESLAQTRIPHRPPVKLTWWTFSRRTITSSLYEIRSMNFLFIPFLAQSVSHSASAFGRLFSNLHLARRDIVLAASSLDVSTQTSLRGLPISKHALFSPAVSSAIKDCAKQQRDSLALQMPGPLRPSQQPTKRPFPSAPRSAGRPFQGGAVGSSSEVYEGGGAS